MTTILSIAKSSGITPNDMLLNRWIAFYVFRIIDSATRTVPSPFQILQSTQITSTSVIISNMFHSDNPLLRMMATLCPPSRYNCSPAIAILHFDALLQALLLICPKLDRFPGGNV